MDGKRTPATPQTRPEQPVSAGEQLTLPAGHLDRARLSCGHEATFDRLTHPLYDDSSWYRAVRCDTCGRPREVIVVIYRRPEPLPTQNA